MRERTFTRSLLTATAAATSAFLAYAFTHPAAAPPAPQAKTTSTAQAARAPIPAGAPPTATTQPPVDVSALLHPANKYLGVVQDGVPNSMTRLAQFSTQTGVRPDMVAYYVPWGVPLNQTWVLDLADDSILPLIQFEPGTPAIAQIAAGASDTYTTTLAQTAKALDVPIVISFGHEMNGNWYTWGTKRQSRQTS